MLVWLATRRGLLAIATRGSGDVCLTISMVEASESMPWMAFIRTPAGGIGDVRGMLLIATNVFARAKEAQEKSGHDQRELQCVDVFLDSEYSRSGCVRGMYENKFKW